MQSAEITRFFNHVEATSRPDVWEKRKRLIKPLMEWKYSSINLLVRSVDGNTRDRMWVSEAIKAGHIARGLQGALGLPTEEPMTDVEATIEAAYRALGDVVNVDFEKGDAMFKAAQRAQAQIEERRIARGEEP